MQVAFTMTPPGMAPINFSLDMAKVGPALGGFLVAVGTEMAKPTFNWQALLAAILPVLPAILAGNWAAVFAALPAIIAALFGK